MKLHIRLGLWLMMALAVVVIPLPALAENLVSNSSLEAGGNTYPDGWQREKLGNNVALFSYVRDSVSTSRYLQIQTTQYTQGHAAWFFNPVPVAGSSTYTYESRYQATTESTLMARFFRGTAYTDTVVRTVPSATTWSPLAATITVPAGTTAITVMHQSTAVGTLAIDDIVLTNKSGGSPDPTPDPDPDPGQNPPPEPPTGNLIANASVETGSFTYPDGWQREKRGNHLARFSYPRQNGYAGNRRLDITVSQYVSGQSSWYFNPVPVTGNTSYTYTMQYTADAPTRLVLRTTNAAGTLSENVLTTLSPTPDRVNPRTVSHTFTMPSGAVTATVLVQLPQNGNLATDNFSLVRGAGGGPGTGPTPEPPATTTPTSLIPNGSFEMSAPGASGRPDTWTPAQHGNNTARFTYPVPGPTTGSRAIKVEVTNYTNGAAFYQPDPFPIKGGGLYEFSYRYRANVYAEVDVAYYLSDGTVEYQYLGVSVPSPTSWGTFKTQVTVPPNAERAIIYGLLYSNGYLITDEYTLSPLTLAPLPKPIVSLTFDDAFTSFYDYAVPLFDRYGMQGTLYLVSQDFNQPNYMSTAELKTLAAKGFELGSHSVTHAHFPQLSLEALRFELDESKRVIAEQTGITPKNFATPYGEYNEQVLTEIMRRYQSHRSVDVGYNGANFERSNIRSMSPINTTSPETVLGWVDTAIANKAWLTITYHDIIPNGATFTNSPEHLATVLAGLAARGVSVMTVDEALTYLSN